MAGGVQVTRLDRFDHQLQQFLVRALQSEVYCLNLSQSEKWNPERSSGDSAVSGVQPCKNEHDRPSQQIDPESRQHCLAPKASNALFLGDGHIAASNARVCKKRECDSEQTWHAGVECGREQRG